LLGIAPAGSGSRVGRRAGLVTANYEWRDMALVFNVINIDKAQFAGCLWNEPHIKIESLTQ
jgi:hypothetical protein